MPPVSLPVPLASPHDLFGKLKRDAALLIDDEITTDRFFSGIKSTTTLGAEALLKVKRQSVLQYVAFETEQRTARKIK